MQHRQIDEALDFALMALAQKRRNIDCFLNLSSQRLRGSRASRQQIIAAIEILNRHICDMSKTTSERRLLFTTLTMLANNLVELGKQGSYLLSDMIHVQNVVGYHEQLQLPTRRNNERD